MQPSHIIQSNPTYLAIWNAIVPEIEQNIAVEAVDVTALESLVVNIDLLNEARATLNRDGLTYTNAGLTKVNPAFSVKQDLERVLHTLFHRFGMTPLDRKHIGVKPAAAQTFSFDEPM